jgi:hypothetical protein
VSDYGDATITQMTGGRLIVERADRVIGISLELLAQADPVRLPIDESGCIMLAGDPGYRYRPVRFASHPTAVGEGARVLVCERVEDKP